MKCHGSGPTGMSLTTPVQVSTALQMWTPQQSVDTDSPPRLIAAKIRAESSKGHGWGGNWTSSVAADQIWFPMSSAATTIQLCQDSNYLVGIDVQSPISVILSVKIIIKCLGFIYFAFLALSFLVGARRYQKICRMDLKSNVGCNFGMH